MAPIKLRLYDLSQGMAASFSQAVIGTHIEAIYHSGVDVFGTEYFFGGGIQGLPINGPRSFPSLFGMRPMRVVELGTTTKTRADLEVWCAANRQLFTTATYDLLRNNCNNFSDALVRFLTDGAVGVPRDVLEL